MLYFYFGVFPTKTGVNINIDKDLILNDAVISFMLNGKKSVLQLKNLGLKNEVKINDIRYSNLKFLTLNNFKQEQVDVFY